MALDIADGKGFYLREVSPYIGAPFIWLLALVYKVFGPSLEATMLVPWTIGTLTLVPTYLLGRELGGRVVGTLAALLLATSAAQTVISSHVPISHSLTPLLTTTVLWLVARALNTLPRPLGEGLGEGWGRLLALAGLLTGLALQTHPTAAPLLAGAALGALIVRPAWLRTRWPAIALALVLVGYSSLLVYHLTSHFEVLSDIQDKQARYLDAEDDSGTDTRGEAYPVNLGRLLLSSARLVSGTIEEREGPADFLTDPWVLAPAGLALAGLVVAARQRAWWLLGAVLLAVVLPPAFNGKYRPVLDGRFLMPLVPILFVAIGLAVASMLRGLITSAARVGEPRTGTAPTLTASRAFRRLVPSGGLVALGIAVTLLVAGPLFQLRGFYESSIEDGSSNSLYLQTLHLVEAARRDDEAVLLDPRLSEVKTGGGGKASTSLSWLLAVSRVPSQPLGDGASTAELDGRLAILQRDTADRLDDVLTLQPLDGKRLSGREKPSYRAYRIVGSTAQHTDEPGSRMSPAR